MKQAQGASESGRQEDFALASDGRRYPAVGLLIVSCIAALLSLWRLGSRDLWQDEGETAVLARSVLQHGMPLAKVGGNLVLQDAVAFDEHYRWTFHPWGQFYLAAASFAMLGESDFSARLPFALCGVATVALLHCFVWRQWRCARTAAVCALLLALSTPFIIHARQCRYYGADGLACLLVVFSLVEVAVRPNWRWVAILGFAVAFQFEANFGTLFAMTPGLVLLAIILRASRRAWGMMLCGIAGGLVVVSPLVLIHGRRLFEGGGAGEFGWHLKALTHVSFWNNSFAPIIVFLAAGCAVLLRSGWAGFKPFHVRLTLGIVVLSLTAACVIAYPARFPHVRYMIALMPLAKLSLGVVLMGFFRWILIRVRSRTLAIGTTALLFVALATTNVCSVPMQIIANLPDQKTPDFCTSSPPYVRFDFVGLIAELTGDFVSSDRFRRNAVNDLTETGEMVLVNYGDLPVMFHRRDLLVRGGLGTGTRPVEQGKSPELILIQRRAGMPFGEYLDTLLRGREYEGFRVAVPDVLYGNIPEPTAHYFATPKAQSEMLIYIRRDHLARLEKLPSDPDELVRRWSR